MTTKRRDENSQELPKKEGDGKSGAPDQNMSLRDRLLSLGMKVADPSSKGFVIGTGGKLAK